MIQDSRLLSRPNWLAIVVLLMFATAGCSGSQPAVPEVAVPAEQAEERVNITLEPIDAERYAEVLARHRGKVVLVDFWALWCPPCVAKFPHVVELHERLASLGLVVLSVSLDEPEDADAVLRFLVDKRAAFENYHSLYGVGSAVFEAFDLEAVPHIKLYDRQGELHRTFSGSAIELAELERVIAELL